MSQDGPKLPERLRPNGLPQAKRWGSYAAKVSLKAAYRGLQPTATEGFSKAPDQTRLKRFYTETEDGWRLPVYQLPLRPGASGEPILLAHGLGFNHHSLQFHQERSLAWSLQKEGFAVFFLAHRGDHGTMPPDKAKGWDFDTIAHLDVPAVVDAILKKTGFAKLSWVGHGLGGQLLYGYLANTLTERIASASCLGAPVRFPTPHSHARALRMALGMLPANFELPTRKLGQFFSPALKSGSAQMKQLGFQEGEADVVRGLLLHGTENCGAGLLQQILLWTEVGFLCDRLGKRDLAAEMEGLTVPLQLITAESNTRCPPQAAFAVADFVEGPVEVHALNASWGQNDLLLAPQASVDIFPKIVGWMERHRKRAWRPVVDVVPNMPTEDAMDNSRRCAKAI
jgi:pimeloyl-ACP methyl ester carboxylesterase